MAWENIQLWSDCFISALVNELKGWEFLMNNEVAHYQLAKINLFSSRLQSGKVGNRGSWKHFQKYHRPAATYQFSQGSLISAACNSWPADGFQKKKDASFEWRMYFNCRPCKVRILIVWTWHDTFCTALRQSQQRLLCMTRMHTNTHKFDQQHFELWARILQSLRHFSVHHRSLVYMFTGCVQTVVVASHPTHLSVTICPSSPTLCMVYSLWLITLLDLRHYPFTTSFTEELGVFTTGRSNVILLKLDICCCSVL